MSKKVKSVAFNLAIPHELQLYRFAIQQGNFSQYVKRLIQRDLEGGQKVAYTPEEQQLWRLYQNKPKSE